MIKMFYFDRNMTYDKILKWLKENDVEYTIINLKYRKFKKEDILKLINNVDDINELISTKSSMGKSTNCKKLLNKSIDEFCNFVIDNPRVFKLPVMYNERFVQIGYSDEDIDVFLPREKRTEMIRCLMNN